MSFLDNFELPSFFVTKKDRSGALTQDELDVRRRIAVALATRRSPYPKNIGEGLTALGEGLADRFAMQDYERSEAASRSYNENARRSLLDPALPSPSPVAPSATPPVAPSPQQQRSVAPSPIADAMGYAPETPELQAALAPQSQEIRAPRAPAPMSMPSNPAQPMTMEEWMQRIRRNESGGAKGDPYQLVGVRSRRGDYPYGAYQVMGENIPAWTKTHLGRELTPQQFLADPDAQDAVARGQGGLYVNKYGADGAARAWFAGERGMNDPNRKDTLGTHVAEYSRRFNRPLPVTKEQIAASLAGQDQGLASGEDARLADVTGNTGTPQPRVRLAQRNEPTVSDVPGAMGAMTDAGVGGAATDRRALVSPQQQVAELPAPPIQTIPKAPTPQAPPSQQQQLPQRIDPGPMPVRPDPRTDPQLQRARAIALDPYVNAQTRATAEAQYQELLKQKNEDFVRRYTLWHEQFNAREEQRINAPKLQSDLATAEQGRVERQGQIEDAAEQRLIRNRIGGRDPQDFFKEFDKQKQEAQISSEIMRNNQIIMSALKDGVIQGWGADFRLNVTKLAAWAFKNGYASEQAANTEIAKAMTGARYNEALKQINPAGSVSNFEGIIAGQMSGTSPKLEPKAFLEILRKSSESAARTLNDFEERRDYTIGGTRSERLYDIQSRPIAPSDFTQRLLQNRDDKAMRAQFDELFGDGAAALTIERAKRRERRGG